MSIQAYIEKLEETLPNVACPKDLVKLGIFNSKFEAAQRRIRGQPPEYISFSEKRVGYPKACIIEWLQQRAEESLKKRPESKVEPSC